jgi:hypothetical protein
MGREYKISLEHLVPKRKGCSKHEKVGVCQNDTGGNLKEFPVMKASEQSEQQIQRRT